MLGQLTELCKSNHIFSMLNLFYIDVGVPILDKKILKSKANWLAWIKLRSSFKCFFINCPANCEQKTR